MTHHEREMDGAVERYDRRDERGRSGPPRGRGDGRSAPSGRVLLLALSERTSAKGTAYLSGWLGKASVVAFRGDPDKNGCPTWDVYLSTREPRPGGEPR